MILGANRPAVIENIRSAAQTGDFHAKVELDDPVLTKEECQAITERCLPRERTLFGRMKVRAARGFANAGSAVLNRHTEIRVNGDLSALKGDNLVDYWTVAMAAPVKGKTVFPFLYFYRTDADGADDLNS